MSLGVCDPDARVGFGLAEARDRAAAVLKAARQGRDLAGRGEGRPKDEQGENSVTDLIDRYAKHITGPHRKSGALKTGVEIERRLKRALKAKMMKPPTTCGEADIEPAPGAVADGRPREAEKRRQVIGAMYRWGVSKGYVATDPTAGTEGYGKGDPRERTLSRSELRDVWTSADDGAGQDAPRHASRPLKLQICLGRSHWRGCRHDGGRVEVEGDRLHLDAARQPLKNKRERVTPLVGMAREIVEKL